MPAARRPLLVPALAVAVSAISFAAIFFRLAAPTDPLVAAGLRLAIAACVLAPFVWRARRRGALTPRTLRAGVLAGLLYGAHFGTWVTSLTLTSVAASVTLVTATPILLGIAALVTGRDRPSPRHWAAIGLGVIGVMIIAAAGPAGSTGHLAGDALALAGAAAMAGYLLAGRRLGLTLDPLAFTGIAAAVGATILLGIGASQGVPLTPPSGAAFGWILLAALVPQLIGHTLLTWALRHTRPTVVGMATVGEPVGSTLLAWLWLGEDVGAAIALGCAVTLAGVLLALFDPRRR